MIKYYYDKEGNEIFDFTELDECIDYYQERMEDNEKITIIEMKPSRKEESFCQFYSSFSCESQNCYAYVPRNNKNGICKFHSFGLIKTGRKWEITNNSIKKISSRKRSFK